jgi:hypothetical protein
MSQQIKGEKKKLEKLEEGKYPFRFLLEIKDLIKPIVIKRIQIIKAVGFTILVAMAGGVIWYHFFKAPSGDQLVERMVVAAGGMEAWNKIDHGKFTRIHRLFSETGEMAKERVESIYFEKINGNIQLMIEVKSPTGVPVTIGKDKEGFWAVENNTFVNAKEKAKELGMMCDSQWCQPNCEMTMAFYRFSMPFKLKDDGVIAENGGKDALLNREGHRLNISYRAGVGKDKWVFYADTENNLIMKMEYHHHTDHGNDLPEEFYWNDHKKVGDITVSTKWTRYWGNGKVLEEYTFSDFDFESKLPNQFYARPKDLLTYK